MSDKKPSVQETFNAIAMAGDLNSLQSSLSQIDLHDAKDKAELIQALETEFVEGFTEGLPTQEQMELLLALGAMVGEGPDAEDAEMIQGCLLIADKILTEKGDKASPLVQKLIEKASELTDAEYNDPATLMKAAVSAAHEAKAMAPKTANPFRNRGNKGPNA
ncbi:MAG: hypothetical protein EP349_05335 [Alphaproteobacteria bacterium]|nr:MAG: hypothetical protein EP349_05335 [Alphaproteobacteria bacterium]